jgi:hypothetical protein
MKGRFFLWGTLAAVACTLYYFRGDINRYTKMKMM